MLRRVAAFCRPLRPVLLLVSFPRSQSPVVGVLGQPPRCALTAALALPPQPLGSPHRPPGRQHQHELVQRPLLQRVEVDLDLGPVLDCADVTALQLPLGKGRARGGGWGWEGGGAEEVDLRATTLLVRRHATEGEADGVPMKAPGHRDIRGRGCPDTGIPRAADARTPGYRRSGDPEIRRPGHQGSSDNGIGTRRRLEGNRRRLEGTQRLLEGTWRRLEGNRRRLEGNWRPLEGTRRPLKGTWRRLEGNRRPLEGNRRPLEGTRRPLEGTWRRLEGNRRRLEGNRRRLEGTRWPLEGTRWRLEGTRWRLEGTRWRLEGTRWRLEGTRWRLEGN